MPRLVSRTSQRFELNELNDDAAEKQNRRRSNISGSGSVSSGQRSARSSGAGIQDEPTLANFEQWMKLVKDNKINAQNSWNFALIDYFHDMSLLREGDSINFQKASFTLDGCVKIYSSRIDSVASETGKLLSGLTERQADQAAAARDEEERDGASGDDEDDGSGSSDPSDPLSSPKKKKRAAGKRTKQQTLARFEQIKAKKVDSEFHIDPLFRKMCADFDEGGARGLLLNTLTTGADGRVVFAGEEPAEDEGEPKAAEDLDGQPDKPGDSQESKATAETDDKNAQSPSAKNDTTPHPYNEADFAMMRDRYFSMPLTNASVCPSLPAIRRALQDPALGATGIVEGFQSLDDAPSFAENVEDADDDIFGGGDISVDDLVDDGVETWGGGGGGADADNMSTVSRRPSLPANNQSSSEFTLSTNTEANLLAYFDDALRKNWAGPEHWKIARVRQSESKNPQQTGTSEKKAQRKSNISSEDALSVDFFSAPGPGEDINDLFAVGKASIDLPSTQMTSKSRYLLPDDRHFSSVDLIKLYLKPRGIVRKYLDGGKTRDSLPGQASNEAVIVDTLPDVDENFWASSIKAEDVDHPEATVGYDANFFHEDDNDVGDVADDLDFGGDYDMPESDNLEPGLNSSGAFLSSQPFGRNSELRGLQSGYQARENYVSYAKSSKKVDIRALKDNIWDSLGLEATVQERIHENKKVAALPEPVEGSERNFTETLGGLSTKYSSQQMNDLSTSYCFICILHLANEKGLILESTDNLEELKVDVDANAVLAST